MEGSNYQSQTNEVNDMSNYVIFYMFHLSLRYFVYLLDFCFNCKIFELVLFCVPCRKFEQMQEKLFLVTIRKN